VRFAPSPTGYLHVGGARTALFNWLFSRHEGGSFVLRIEDTDVERSTEQYERQLLEDMAWLGLKWDEGPGSGGEYGPYRQSERVGIYGEYVGKLLDGGMAYRCYCTDEELADMKEKRLAAGLPPRYDGRCRKLTDQERGRLKGEGRPESVRFAVSGDSQVKISDIIRGEVTFPEGMVGDFIISRSNGLPTYNFAAAVDDALMNITHVIRGEEHLSNTYRQVMIYEALGFGMPAFAHIPLILGSDRSKLSKRHGAPNIKEYRARGYPSEAVVNYLAFLGWSAPGGEEIMSLEELSEKFGLDRVSDSPGIFDEGKLNWVSAHHVREGGSGRYLDEALPFFPGELLDHYDREAIAGIMDILSENLPSFSKIPDEVAPFRPGTPEMDGEAAKELEGAGELLASVAGELGRCGRWDEDEIRQAVKRAGKLCGVKGRGLYMPVRAALTGVTHGPDLTSIIRIRGKEDVLASLEASLRRSPPGAEEG